MLLHTPQSMHMPRSKIVPKTFLKKMGSTTLRKLGSFGGWWGGATLDKLSWARKIRNSRKIVAFNGTVRRELSEHHMSFSALHRDLSGTKQCPQFQQDCQQTRDSRTNYTSDAWSGRCLPGSVRRSGSMIGEGRTALQTAALQTAARTMHGGDELHR